MERAGLVLVRLRLPHRLWLGRRKRLERLGRGGRGGVPHGGPRVEVMAVEVMAVEVMAVEVMAVEVMRNDIPASTPLTIS